MALGIELIEVIIGLIFIFLLVSIMVTVVNEIVATNLQFRGRLLQENIIKMLKDEQLAKEGKCLSDRFLEHPTIKNINEAHGRLTFLNRWFFTPKASYISPRVFSTVVLDLLDGYEGEEDPLKNAAGFVNNLPGDSKIKEILVPFVVEADGDYKKLKSGLQAWFNETMVGVSDHYKRRNQYYVFTIGLIIAMVFNVDTIHIARELSKNPEQRLAVVSSAASYIDNEQSSFRHLQEIKNESPKGDPDIKVLESHSKELQRLAREVVKNELTPTTTVMGVGWDLSGPTPMYIVRNMIKEAKYHWIGWILTALATSLGAPFWFDLLKRVVAVRTSLKPSTEKKTDSEE